MVFGSDSQTIIAKLWTSCSSNSCKFKWTKVFGELDINKSESISEENGGMQSKAFHYK